MRFETIKTHITAAVLCLAAGAHAQTLKLNSAASNTGDFVFSSTLLQGNSLASITLSAVSPAVIDSNGNGATSSITGVTLDANNVIQQAASTGGTLQTASHAVFAVTNGGHLSVSNLTYHADTNEIFGDLSGGNGVSNMTQVAVFTVTTETVDGTTVSSPSTTPITAGTHTIVDSGLFLASAAIDSYFKTALGLTGLGASELDNINNPSSNSAGFGTLTSTMTFVPTPVPETSPLVSFVMGGFALAALGWQRARSVPRRAR